MFTRQWLEAILNTYAKDGTNAEIDKIYGTNDKNQTTLRIYCAVRWTVVIPRGT